MKKNKVIILGKTGLIGSLLLKYYRNRRAIYGYSTKDCDFKNLWQFKKKVGDKINKSSIIFAAGKHRKYGSTRENYNNNIKIIENLIKLCKKNKPNKIIFLSTVEVYKPKNKKEIISEKTKTNPINLYARSKLKQEKMLIEFCEKNNVNLLILRLPGFYGRFDKDKSIISKLIDCAITNKKFKQKSTGNELRDYIYISDVIKIIQLFELKNIKNDIINVVTGRSLSINIIIKKIENLFYKKINIKKFKKSLSFNLRFNNRKLKNILKKYTFKSVEDGIKEYKINEK